MRGVYLFATDAALFLRSNKEIEIILQIVNECRKTKEEN